MTFAELVLLLSVPLVLLAFSAMRPPLALVTCFLAATLLLPERVGFDVVGLPPLDKRTLTAAACLLGCLAFRRHRLTRLRWSRLDALLVVLFLAAFGTALTNRDPLSYGFTVLPPLRPYDAVSMVAHDLLVFASWYLLGRALIRSPSDLRLVLVSLAIAALAYSPLVLFEIRMSPHLHLHLYGHHPHSFDMSFRLGGWRPSVFMAHGLALALFLLVSVCAALTLQRLRMPILGLHARYVSVYLGGVLIMCKSLGSLVYLAALGPLFAFARARTQARFAAVLCLFFASYPVLRLADVLPTQPILEAARSISEQRAESLAVRFEQELALYNKARERLWFGWGAYGRNRIVDEEGIDRSLTDSYLAIVLGPRGVFGAIATFGLLAVPVWFTLRRLGRVPRRRDRLLLSSTALMVSLLLIDLIPNGLFNPLVFLLAGGLFTVARAQSGIHRQIAGPQPPRSPADRRPLDGGIRRARSGPSIAGTASRRSGS